MNKLDLNLCPISVEQLEREFINIFEQLTGLKNEYFSETAYGTSFCFRIVGTRVPDNVIEIMEKIDLYFHSIEVNDNKYIIHVGLDYGSRKLGLYKIIGDLLFDYISALKNNRYNETDEDKVCEFLDKFGKFIFKEKKGDLYEIKNMSPEDFKMYLGKFKNEKQETD